MSKTYSMVVGAVLLVWGVIGLFADSFLGITTTGLQVWLFIIAGVLALWLGRSEKNRMSLAKWYGIVFTIIGVLGLLVPGFIRALTLDAGGFASIVHLIVGLWGLWAGFKKGAGSQTAAPMPPSPPSGA